MKWTSRKKLKIRIAELERDKRIIEFAYSNAKNDIDSLCENYNSENSMLIRLGRKIFKSMDEQDFQGDVINTETKGIFQQEQE